MSFKPFFSIVIPTKNRAHILDETLVSIINQDFYSYELIVIDNDDTNATELVCKKYPTLSYLKTGGFDMFQNWNFGIEQAKGDWILVLEDKQALYPKALFELSEIVKKYQIKSTLCFEGDYFNDLKFDGVGVVKRKIRSNVVTKKKSVEVLKDYEKSLLKSQEKYNVISYLPRPNTSIVSNELLQKTKKRFGTYCSFGALDFTSGIKKLLLSENVYHLDKSIYLVTTMKESNGLYSAINREDAHARDIKIADENYKKVLAGLPFNELSMTNVFLVDYITIMNKFDKDFILNIDKYEYLYRIFKDIYNIHAVSRRVKIGKSLIKYAHIFLKTKINNIKKIQLILKFINHILKTNLFIIYFKIKNIIEIKKNNKYKNPTEYFQNYRI